LSAATVTIAVWDSISLAPISGAVVTLAGVQQTTANGVATFSNIAYGTYIVNITRVGYAPLTVGNVTVDAADKLFNFYMTYTGGGGTSGPSIIPYLVLAAAMIGGFILLFKYGK
jgi:hypothetical protein